MDKLKQLESFVSVATSGSLTAAANRGQPSADLLCRLAEAQLGMGQAPEAAATLRQALALDPRHPASRELWGRIDIAERQRGMQR